MAEGTQDPGAALAEHPRNLPGSQDRRSDAAVAVKDCGVAGGERGDQ